MKVIKISFPTSLAHIEDIENDNIDVFVELEGGLNITLVVTTPKNLIWYMNKENKNYLEAGPPDIIVRSLTEENISDAIESYASGEAYWLKLYYLAGLGEGTFEIKEMDRMINETLEE